MEGVTMTDSKILKTMARYNQWANRDLFTAVRTLPEGEVGKQRRSLFKNILNTVCGKSARTDLCGGRPVMDVPTAIPLLTLVGHIPGSWR
jgi:hypothetical protein